MTSRQAEVLRFILIHHGERGYPPSVREIAAALVPAVTVATAFQHVSRLVVLGYLSRGEGYKRRTLAPTEKAHDWHALDLIERRRLMPPQGRG